MKRPGSFQFNSRNFGRIVLVGGVLAGWLALCGCGKKEAGTTGDKRWAALGQVMAERTTALCNNGGNIVLLINKNDQANDTSFAQTADAFRKHLGPAVKVMATESIDLPLSAAPGMEPFSANQLADVLQKYATADYVVSFVGVPRLTTAQIAQLPSPRPPMIVVIARSQPTPEMFSQKVVSLVAVPKMLSDAELAEVHSGRAMSAQEVFDAQYQVLPP